MQFLDQAALTSIAQLRKNGMLDEAETALRNAEPSPAVLEELRKVLSSRASAAKKAGDWASVVSHLSAYQSYAASKRAECIKIANAEPPPLSDKDRKMLEEAISKIK